MLLKTWSVLVMPMYHWLEYSLNYSDMTDSLWFHCKDEITNFNVNVTNTGDFKSFKYKTDLLHRCRWSEWDFKKCNNCCFIQISKAIFGDHSQ